MTEIREPPIEQNDEPDTDHTGYDGLMIDRESAPQGRNCLAIDCVELGLRP